LCVCRSHSMHQGLLEEKTNRGFRASHHGLEHGRGESIVALARIVSGSTLYQPPIAHAKAVRINGFLHPKEQGEDAKYSMLIGPTVNTILSYPSLSLAITRHCTEHLECSNIRWMLDSAPSSVLCPEEWARSYCAMSHCSGFEIDKTMAAVATNAKAEVAGTLLNP
jgi:hypothetical protein